jgi:hypothetical protein
LERMDCSMALEEFFLSYCYIIIYAGPACWCR